MSLVSIILPKLGESVSEATITSWLVKVGDQIQADDILCEIGTDKVESELPSEYSGIVKEIFFQEGDVVKVGESIATINVEGDLAEEVKDSPKETVKVPLKQPLENLPKTNTLEKHGEFGFLTPVVRNMIREHEIEMEELHQIKGTGENHRITKKDIQHFLQAKQKLTLPKGQKLQLQILEEDQVHSLSRRRRILSNHLQKASQIIPHVTTFIDIDVSEVVKIRESQKVDFLEEYQSKLTFTHFFQYAVIQALQEYPALNSWLNEDEWIWKNQVNLGFAAALKSGDLVVPNLKAAEKYSFIDFVAAMNSKAEEAKTNHLKPSDLEHTTFTVSNTGMFGSMMGTPIVSLPQVAVLAFGQIVRKPIVANTQSGEQIIPADVMTCSLSYDHRVIDGALASQFLVSVKEKIQGFDVSLLVKA